MINAMARDKVIVISTHLLEEVEVVCTRAIVIANGKIVADGSPIELEARSIYHNAVAIRVTCDQAENCRTRIQSLEGVANVELIADDSRISEIIAFPSDGQIILEKINDQLRGSGIDVEQVRVERGRLDEVFRRLTTAA